MPSDVDQEVSDAFQRVRQAYRDGRGPGETALFQLEQLVARRLSALAAQAEAVADANVRAIELVERQRELGERLDAQNRELAEQNRRIEAARQEIEAQLNELATAHVEAMLKLDEREQRLAEVAAARARLSDVTRLLTGRAEALEREARALAESNTEAVLMLEAREQALAEAERQAHELLAQRTELEQKAFVDVMTGLFNHRYFKEQAIFELARARRYGRALSVIFIDVDHFKKLNDTHGHQVGDQVLTTVGRILSNEVRSADIAVRMDGAPFAVRYGGEEFVVILPETDADGARCVAERLRARLESADIPGGHTQPGGRVTISAGVASVCAADTDLESLVRRADAALYAAKQGGRNRVVVAPPPDGHEALRESA